MLNNTTRTDLNIPILTTNHKEKQIRGAVCKLQRRYFSIDDVYSCLGFTKSKRKEWNRRNEIYPPCLIHSVFREMNVCSRGRMCCGANEKTARYFLPIGIKINEMEEKL